MIHSDALNIIKNLTFNDFTKINKSFIAYDMMQASYIEKQNIGDLLKNHTFEKCDLDLEIINKALLILTTIDINLTDEYIYYMNWCHNFDMKIESVASVHPDLENIFDMFYSMVWGFDEVIEYESENEQRNLEKENEYYSLAYKHRDGDMHGEDITRARELGYDEFL